MSRGRTAKTASCPPDGPGTWGILGGTFDPVHYAHLAIAEQTRQALDLAGVLFLPTGVPVHKPERIVSAPRHRVAMVERAIADNACFALCTVEIERAGPSYTVDTLEELLANDAHASSERYVVILSVEALLGLPRWRQPERILDRARVAVVPRLGYPALGRAWVAEHFPGREQRVIFLDGPTLGHSASDIRHRVAAGRTIRYLVPSAVEAYIAEHALYPAELWQKN